MESPLIEAVAELHEQVRQFIEQQFEGFYVTRIDGSTNTHYAVPPGQDDYKRRLLGCSFEIVVENTPSLPKERKRIQAGMVMGGGLAVGQVEDLEQE